MTEFAVHQRNTRPWLFVGWCWFLGTLVPVIGLVQVGDQAIANRYTYVPLVGVFIALVWGLDEWLDHRAAPLLRPGLSAVVLALCALTTRSELRHWQDGVSVFAQAVRVTKNNFVAMTNLGNNLARVGQPTRAIEVYRQSLEIRPENATTHYNLAIALAETGQTQAAERHYREALRHQPNHAGAHHNLANLLAEQRRYSEALEHYAVSLRLQPKNLEARFNYGMTLNDSGQRTNAIGQFETLVQQAPVFPQARLQLVTLYGLEGNLDAAIKHNDALLEQEPESVHGQFNAGSLASLRGNWPAALLHWETAARLKPDFLPALYRLGWTLATHPDPRIRNPARALTIAEQALQIAGQGNADFLDLLAAANAATGRFDQAMANAKLAIAATGTNAMASQDIRSRLLLYEAGRPFVESAPK